ncbi:MAG: hypothetical protein V1934_00920 [Methanobacteriota archaeon]
MKQGHAITVGATLTVLLILVGAAVLNGLVERPNIPDNADRLAAIPSGSHKWSPGEDNYPPVMLENGWTEPVPLPGPINTAGAEDSPFASGNRLFFFFTPDMNIPLTDQAVDGMTGIWWSERAGDGWTEPKRAYLGSFECLDGAECVRGDEMWFGSVRKGNLGEIDIYAADYDGSGWRNIRNAGERLNVELDIGEFHIWGDELYFAANRTGTKGGLDIWMCEREGDGWSDPVNVGSPNSAMDENQPFVSDGGKELWFTKWGSRAGPSCYRCLRQPSGEWGAPVEIAANFAGEPTLDSEGNLYFVHHFLEDGEIFEADIYVAYRS